MIPNKVEVNGVKLTPQVVFRGSHRGIQFKIMNWQVGDMQPIWNYYLYIPESKVSAETWNKIWLEDQKFRFNEKSPERIYHDYDKSIVSDVEMHGGITYYAKHGHSEGNRCVEIGCDYNHIWDQEHGPYTIEEVAAECIESVNDAITKLGIVTEEQKQQIQK